MHLFKSRDYAIPERFVKIHHLPSLRPFIKKGGPGNITAQHFLQAHGLGAKLQPVFVARFGPTMLILNRIGSPCSFAPMQPNTLRITMELHDITYPRDSQTTGEDPKTAHNQQITATFRLLVVIRTLMFN